MGAGAVPVRRTRMRIGAAVNRILAMDDPTVEAFLTFFFFEIL